MRNNEFLESKLGALLIKLSQRQKKEMNKWLQSPLNRYPKKLTQLYQFILKQAPKFESKSLSKERLYQHLYPNKKINVGTTKNLLSDLFSAIEDYLAYEQYQNDKITKNKMLRRGYKILGDETKLKSLLDREITILNKSEIEDPQISFAQFDLELKFYDLIKNEFTTEESKTILENSHYKLNEAYSLLLARHLVALVQHQNIRRNQKFDLSNESERLKSLNNIVDSPLLDIYLLYLSQSEPSKKITTNIFEKYKIQFSSINTKDQKYIYYLLLNNYNFLYDREHIDAKEFLSIYKFGLDSNLLTRGNKLATITYTNIVVASNLAEDFEYTKFFIEKYTVFLSNKSQLEAKLYGETHLLYKSGKLQVCLDKVSNYTFTDSNLSIKIQLTLLQLYFDLFLNDDSYFELLQNFSAAYEKRVRRNTNYSESKKDNYTKSIQLIRKIVKLIHANDKESLQKLLSKSEKQKGLLGHLWLRKKYDEIRSKYIKK